MHHRMEILNNFCINIPRRFLWLGTKEHCFKTMSVEIALINIHLVFRCCSVSSNEAKSSSVQSNTFLSELKYSRLTKKRNDLRIHYRGEGDFGATFRVKTGQFTWRSEAS